MRNNFTLFSGHIASNSRYYFLALLFIVLSLTDKSLGMRGVNQIETGNINLACPDLRVTNQELSTNGLGVLTITDQLSTVRGSSYRISFKLRAEVKDGETNPPSNTTVSLLVTGSSSPLTLTSFKIDTDNSIRYFEHLFSANQLYNGIQLISESTKVNIYASDFKFTQVENVSVRPTVIGNVSPINTAALNPYKYVKLSSQQLTVAKISETGLIRGVTLKLRKVGSGGAGKYRVGIWVIGNNGKLEQRLSTVEFLPDELDEFRDKRTGDYLFPVVAKLNQMNEYALVLDATGVKINYWNKLLVGIGNSDSKDLKLRGYQPGINYVVLPYSHSVGTLIPGAVAEDSGNVGQFSYTMNNSYEEALNIFSSDLSQGDIGYSKSNRALLLRADGVTEAVYKIHTNYRWTEMQIAIDQECKRSVPINSWYSYDGIAWIEIAPTISERTIGSGNDITPVINVNFKSPNSSNFIYVKIAPNHQQFSNGSQSYSAITGLRIHGTLMP